MGSGVSPQQSGLQLFQTMFSGANRAFPINAEPVFRRCNMCRVASEMCSNSYVYDYDANVYILIYICTIFIYFSIYT